jgi:hypothetical protein
MNVKYKIINGLNFHGTDQGFIAKGDVLQIVGDDISVTRNAVLSSDGKIRFRTLGTPGIGYLTSKDTSARATICIISSGNKRVKVMVSTLPTASDDSAGEWEGEEE